MQKTLRLQDRCPISLVYNKSQDLSFKATKMEDRLIKFEYFKANELENISYSLCIQKLEFNDSNAVIKEHTSNPAPFSANFPQE